MIIQKCHKCNIEKSYTEEFFYYRGSGKILEKVCKECKKAYVKNYKILHEKEVRDYRKLYRKDHREELKEHNKIWEEENKDYRRKYCRKWKEENEDYYREYRNKYKMNRYRLNILFKITACLRRRVNGALRNNYKSGHTINLLGCSIEYLKSHLEKQFQPEMSWGNYGSKGWSIDHILPCSAFDLKNSEEQEICFHYTNLQPLWARDNISKGNKLLC